MFSLGIAKNPVIRDQRGELLDESELRLTGLERSVTLANALGCSWGSVNRVHIEEAFSLIRAALEQAKKFHQSELGNERV